jgi:hypothetical protein
MGMSNFAETIPQGCFYEYQRINYPEICAILDDNISLWSQ